MMTLLILAVEAYLAVVLGVSGLAKLYRPRHFAATLRRHRILPAQSVTAASWLIPCVEVVVAMLLVAGMASVATAITSVGLCLGFLVTEAVLLVSRRAGECGCYGVAFRQRVDGASLIVSGVLTALAVWHLWAVAHVSVSLVFRLPSTAVLLTGVAWMVWQVAERRRIHTGHAVAARM